MSVRLASFNHEGVRYFATLDGGFVQNSFVGRNAVPVTEIQINAGLSAAISQPWGAYRPMTCPVSEDATVVQVGDNFIVHGTCGGLHFELTEMSYDIEEPVKEDAPKEEETPVMEEFPASETPTEEPEELVPADEEEEPTHVEEEVPENDSMYAAQIGAGRGGSFVRNKDLPNKPFPNTPQIVDPVMRASESYRGLRLGVTLVQDSKTTPGAVTQSNRTVPGAITQSNRTTQGDVTQSNRTTYNQHDQGDFLHQREAEDMLHHDEATPKQEEIALNFDSAPKPSGDDFDCEEFLNGLSTEQIAFLREVPSDLLGTINEFTKDQISVTKLEGLGAVYCVENKWKISGDWYAIDEIQTLSRFIFCATTNKYQRIATKTLKGWKKCVEAGLIG